MAMICSPSSKIPPPPPSASPPLIPPSLLPIHPLFSRPLPPIHDNLPCGVGNTVFQILQTNTPSPRLVWCRQYDTSDQRVFPIIHTNTLDLPQVGCGVGNTVFPILQTNTTLPPPPPPGWVHVLTILQTNTALHVLSLSILLASCPFSPIESCITIKMHEPGNYTQACVLVVKPVSCSMNSVVTRHRRFSQ